MGSLFSFGLVTSPFLFHIATCNVVRSTVFCPVQERAHTVQYCMNSAMCVPSPAPFFFVPETDRRGGPHEHARELPRAQGREVELHKMDSPKGVPLMPLQYCNAITVLPLVPGVQGTPAVQLTGAAGHPS